MLNNGKILKRRFGIISLCNIFNIILHETRLLTDYPTMLDTQRQRAQETGYSFTDENDLRTLSQTFSLQHIDYVDIDQQEDLAAAFKRWPLLAELIPQ